MTSELLAVFDYFEKEKGINRATMVEALETALLTAARKKLGPARELRVDLNPEEGTIKAIAVLVASETVEDPFEQLPIEVARKLKPGAELGDEVEVEVTPSDFGRIAAQTAKQAMMQRLRAAEKDLIYDEFKDRAGDIVSGTVRRFERSDVIIDLGRFEGVMHSRERVSTEDYNVGDRIRTYVVAVENGSRGPEIVLSRSHPNFVRRLFESEVSEIADHTVEIRAIARESGYRTKVAVHSHDPKVDPVGACVGLRGARVKNIVRELNNEKVDIIRWCDDPRELVVDALKPAVIRTIDINEEEHKITVTVDEEELSKAIGRRGQNARLTSRIMGWDVQVQKDESAAEALESRIADVGASFVEAAGVTPEVANHLVNGGITDMDTLLSVDAEDIAEILEIEEAEATEIYTTIQTKAGDGVDAPSTAEASETEAETPVAAETAPAEEAAEEPAAEEAATEEVVAEAAEAVEEQAPAEDKAGEEQ